LGKVMIVAHEMGLADRHRNGTHAGRGSDAGTSNDEAESAEPPADAGAADGTVI